MISIEKIAYEISWIKRQKENESMKMAEHENVDKNLKGIIVKIRMQTTE